MKDKSNYIMALLKKGPNPKETYAINEGKVDT